MSGSERDSDDADEDARKDDGECVVRVGPRQTGGGAAASPAHARQESVPAVVVFPRKRPMHGTEPGPEEGVIELSLESLRFAPLPCAPRVPDKILVVGGRRLNAHSRSPSFRPLFQMRQADAAKRLGIAASTLNHVCRQLGIGRWPWRSWRRQKSDRARPTETLAAPAQLVPSAHQTALPAPAAVASSNTHQSLHHSFPQTSLAMQGQGGWGSFLGQERAGKPWPGPSYPHTCTLNVRNAAQVNRQCLR